MLVTFPFAGPYFPWSAVYFLTGYEQMSLHTNNPAESSIQCYLRAGGHFIAGSMLRPALAVTSAMPQELYVRVARQLNGRQDFQKINGLANIVNSKNSDPPFVGRRDGGKTCANPIINRFPGDSPEEPFS